MTFGRLLALIKVSSSYDRPFVVELSKPGMEQVGLHALARSLGHHGDGHGSTSASAP